MADRPHHAELLQHPAGLDHLDSTKTPTALRGPAATPRTCKMPLIRRHAPRSKSRTAGHMGQEAGAGFSFVLPEVHQRLAETLS